MSTEERSPEEIRAEIDRTREELGDTVEALAEKTDVRNWDPRPFVIGGALALLLVILWRRRRS